MSQDREPGRLEVGRPPDRIWILGGWLIVAAVVAWVVIGVSGGSSTSLTPAPSSTASAGAAASGSTSPSARPSTTAAPVAPSVPALLPGGRHRIFEGDPFLVAYYGTAGNGALGVLGERSPQVSDRRLRAQAAKFAVLGRPVQTVYELIVTVADRYPGKHGAYSHDISRAAVQSWIDAAHRNNALVVLDIQTGHADFLSVAKRWSWALADPWVGLALDPEWRMHGHAVPGHVIGHVDAAEINRTSAWLSTFSRQRGLPEKIFMLHQFRQKMIRRPQLIKARPGLAMVQHVDGFGTRSQKLATYRSVARPRQFSMGFKLFYDEDVNRMGPAAVGKIRPRVRFVSFQ
ncbi:hypothetical protein [Nocardioides sp.]|uniref:hypothetical protein n=1 Tax=Nocardioides sp. TaxID=35761 RepID=UPI002627B607|nr:hypothetical protein [Nocardioides sp.]